MSSWPSPLTSAIVTPRLPARRAGHAGARRHVLEPVAATVEVQAIAAQVRREVEIWPAVAVDVARRDAAAVVVVEKIQYVERRILGQTVLEASHRSPTERDARTAAADPRRARHATSATPSEISAGRIRMPSRHSARAPARPNARTPCLPRSVGMLVRRLVALDGMRAGERPGEPAPAGRVRAGRR